MALADAGVDARSISYVEAHGTATPIGDPIEVEALTEAFRDFTEDKQFCAISSLKSNIGHLVAASGAAGLIKTLLSLEHEQIPATANFKNVIARTNIECIDNAVILLHLRFMEVIILIRKNAR